MAGAKYLFAVFSIGPLAATVFNGFSRYKFTERILAYAKDFLDPLPFWLRILPVVDGDDLTLPCYL